MLAVLRVALAVGVLIALPYSHMHWGASYPGDGQQASGFIAIFAAVGFVAAVLFVALGSLAQFLLRRRSPWFTVLVDFGLFLAFAGVLVYGGVTAKYNDTPPNHAASPPVCQDQFILVMPSDPKPHHVIAMLDRDRTVMDSYAHGPKPSDLFEMQ